MVNPHTRSQRVIEAAHKVSLAKAEVGIREKKPVPKLREFIDNDFAPFVESRFANKAKTLEYYRIGLKNYVSSSRWRVHRSMPSPGSCEPDVPVSYRNASLGRRAWRERSTKTRPRSPDQVPLGRSRTFR